MLNEKNKKRIKRTASNGSRDDFEHKYDMEPICSWSDWCSEPDQVRQENHSTYMD